MGLRTARRRSRGMAGAVLLLPLALVLPRAEVEATEVEGRGAGPDLRVDVGADRHAINPEIYGMNFPDPALAKELKLPLSRWGGNSTSRYNWQGQGTNRGSDYYFLNTDFEYPLEDFIAADQGRGGNTLVTVPLLGFVMDPDKFGACGFDIAEHGDQRDVGDGHCGDGVEPGGDKVTGNDPLETSIAIGPGFVTAEVEHLVDTFGSAEDGGVAYYSLDNEPSLWDETHRDVHPELSTYDELTSLGIEYSTAIKSADPSAKVFGPVDWGFPSYLTSAQDVYGEGGDKAAHDNLDLAEWYLAEFRRAEQDDGVRLLDYLDYHYYPEQQGGIQIALTSAGDARTRALRLEMTRALWDPDFVDDSYIGNDMEERVRLIPRMRAYIDEHYPGTKLAITEYNYGGFDDVNGALAQADILGIFGQEGVDLGAVWDPPKVDDPGANGFRIFLNYDGLGGRFGGTSVAAESSDRGSLAVYAAEGGDDVLTVLVINKTTEDLESALTIDGGPKTDLADVWRVTRATERPTPAGSVEVADGGLTTIFPAESISLLVLPGEGHADEVPDAIAAPTGEPSGPEGDTSKAKPSGATSNSDGDSANVLLVLLGGFLIAGGVVVAVRKLGPPQVERWGPIAAIGVGALVIGLGAAPAIIGDDDGSAPPAKRESGSTSAPGEVASGPAAVTITAASAQGFEGTAELSEGQQLFLLVFAPGPQLYYDATDNPVAVGEDGTWTSNNYGGGDPGDQFEVLAFVLSADDAATYQDLDKSAGLAEPPGGAVAEARESFVIG